MKIIESLKRNFPEAKTPLEERFATLRNQTLDAIGTVDPKTARERLIDCCELCQAENTTVFDESLEMLDFLCGIIEVQTIGTAAQKKEMVSQLKTALSGMLSEDELADECLTSLSEGNLKKAKALRDAIRTNKPNPMVLELDRIIKTCESVRSEFKKNPREVTQRVLKMESEANQKQAERFKHLF